MYNAIWAIYHYSSTDDKLSHSKCSTGAESWCIWQCASAKGELASFKNDYKHFFLNVLIAIKPIFEDLRN